MGKWSLCNRGALVTRHARQTDGEVEPGPRRADAELCCLMALPASTAVEERQDTVRISAAWTMHAADQTRHRILQSVAEPFSRC